MDRVGNLSLEAITRERARILAPALTIAFLFFVALDGPLGTSVPAAYLVAAYALCAASALLSLAFWKRKVPDRFVHVASTAALWLPMAATALSLYGSNNYILALYFIIQAASAGVLLDTRLVAGTLAALNALAIPLTIRAGAPYPAVFVSALVIASLFAWLIHVLMRRALVRAVVLQQQLLHTQRMEAVGTLAAGLAHDMNNVLASITSYAELLRQDEDRSELAQILAQVERGAALTRGLLAFSRRGQYRKQVVRLDDVLRDSIALLERTLPKTIEIRTDLQVGKSCVEADPQQVAHALIHLGVNASEAMDGKGTLAIFGELVADRVRVTISDTGRGMDAPTQLRAFEPFFTTKPMGKGTGLGLSTVWGIVQAHRGTVQLASELGRGTTFTIELPLTIGEVAEPPVRVLLRPVEEVPRARVLVIDDEPLVLDATRRLLERLGLDVVTAADGRQGLDKFDASIDLVILDMGMPVMNGSDCFKALRATRDVPVLICTGYADDAQAQECVAAGANLIEKPFLAADLKLMVGRMLPKARALAS